MMICGSSASEPSFQRPGDEPKWASHFLISHVPVHLFLYPAIQVDTDKLRSTYIGQN